MSTVRSIRVSIRRVVARRPWLYWLAVGVAVAAVAATVHDEMSGVAAARGSWGSARAVLVAAEPIEPGESLRVHEREVPVAVAPDGAISDADGVVARQRIGQGEIVTDVDVVAGSAPMSLVPDGWVAVPVVESPPSGAAVGERVQLAGDGIVIADGLIVGRADEATLVAVIARDAPAVAAGTHHARLVVMRVP